MVNIRMGPWSDDDGDERTVIYSYTVNRNTLWINYAYKRGVNIVGFDLVANVCVKYHDNKVPDELIEKLISLGVINKELAEYITENGADTETFADLFWIFCKLGDPDLWVEEVDIPEINIGGYGIVSS